MTRAARFGIDSHSAERDGDGNATYTRNLVAGLLAGPGDDTVVLFAADPRHAFYASLPAPARAEAVRVRQGRGLLRLATLGLLARQRGVDCLHVQYMGPLGYAGPLVATVHDLAYLHMPESFSVPLRLGLRVLVPRTVARATRVITDSEFSRQDLMARYGVDPGKLAVIPLAPAPHFHPRPPVETAAVLARYGLRPGFVFSVGRLNPRKNLERLLLAHGRLRAGGGSRAILVIAGRPDHGNARVLRQLRDSSGRSGVRFVGVIPDADLPHFYGGAACFVYPSLFEGFGLPVVEAMACGAPVVSSDRAALPEVVGEAGLLVDPESVEALAGAMARLVGDEVLASDLGQRGLEHSRRYSWSETVRRTLGVYREAAGR